MASSYPFSLDLNLAPPTQTWGQAAAPVWMPYFASARGPVTVNDSILLDNDVALGVARNLVTPKDIRVLGTRDHNPVMSDALALSVQSTATVASVGHRLLAKSHEVEVLKGQLAAERSLVEECQSIIKSLKRERARIVENMRKQLEDLDRSGKCKQLDRERSYAQAKSAIFGSSSDQPQEAVRENPEEDSHRAKLKAPMVETSSTVKK
ncbi:hypothetical protein ACE6H2_002084 [Prunus campanulata]